MDQDDENVHVHTLQKNGCWGTEGMNEELFNL